MMSEIFWTLVLTTSSGLFLAVCRMMYKSKCKTIKCCNICELDRDVEGEERIDENEINHNYNNENKNQLSYYKF